MRVWRTTRVGMVSMVIVMTCASARAQQDSLAERFERADRDGDGKLTRSEFNQPELFRRLDTNGDGVITLPEISNRTTRLRGTPRQGAAERTVELEMPPMPEHDFHRDIRYASIEGVDPNLLSLDLYVPKKKAKENGHPVLIMIHGGGWRTGDKANQNVVGAKMRHFVGLGYVFASINYRLSPNRPGDEGIRHPAHAEDCAKAIAWIHDHIPEYGGDPDSLHLMGHSAGAHLAGIVGTNERFLKANGKDLSILKSNVLLDTAAIDIPRYVELVGGGSMTAMYRNAFGTEMENWRDASPAMHVEKEKGIPPTLIFYGGSRMLLDTLAPDFAASLTRAGSPSQAINTIDLTHGEINSHVGMIGDPMTLLIMRLHAGEDASRFPGRLDQVDGLDANEPLPNPGLNPGNHTRTIRVGDLERRYLVHIPPGLDPAGETAVVLAFHGGGGNPQSMVRISQLDKKADEAGFIVVFPYGTGQFADRLLTFNGGDCCGYAMEKGVDDVAFVRELLDDLASVCRIDQGAVFATGLSNGGILSYRLAAELSDRIAAIAPVGGPMMMETCNPTDPVAVIHFHGTDDKFAPIEGGHGVNSRRRKGAPEFRSVKDSLEKWIAANECNQQPMVEQLPDTADDGMHVVRKTWSGGTDGTEVVLVEIHGGGHTWPGVKPSGLATFLGKPTMDISANDLMWEFFRKHARRFCN